MTKFEEVLVRIAYVGKLLIGVAGMVATALLGLSDLPAGWKFPLLVVAAVAASVALFKMPNGDSLKDVRIDREIRAYLERRTYGGLTLPQPKPGPDAPEGPNEASGGDIE